MTLTTTGEIMSKHAKYGGSTALRTIKCPAWHRLSQGMPEHPESPAAKLGTSLHAVIETCLLDLEHEPFDEVGKTVEGTLITETHIVEKIDPALDEFENLMDTYDIDAYWVEEWVEISEDVAGTVDFMGISRDGKTGVFADYKSGDGHMVYAEDNAQGLFYAMCALHRIFKRVFKDIEKLVIAIVQPSFRRSEYLDIWETTPAELELFAERHNDAVYASEHLETEPVCGEWCSFCPAEATCPAKLKEVAKVDILPCRSDLPAEISAAMAVVDKVETWAKAVRSTAHDLLNKGVPLDGWKLVDKRATRVWNDPAAAEAFARKSRKLKVVDIIETKFKSPAQLEKAVLAAGLDWGDYAEFVSAISSGTTLASVHDSRPEVRISSATKLLAERFAQ